jgi:hypothetical protein
MTPPVAIQQLAETQALAVPAERLEPQAPHPRPEDHPLLVGLVARVVSRAPAERQVASLALAARLQRGVLAELAVALAASLGVRRAPRAMAALRVTEVPVASWSIPARMPT